LQVFLLLDMFVPAGCKSRCRAHSSGSNRGVPSSSQFELLASGYVVSQIDPCSLASRAHMLADDRTCAGERSGTTS
jgi:hypothetical protein